MKITEIQCFAVFNGARNNLFVTVDTDAGIEGVGESGLSGRELAVMGAIEHFKPLLIGQDATRIEHIWQTLFRGGFFPANRVIGSAISAIDIALWDIQGKALNVPIYRLFGGLVRDRVVCYPHAQAPDERFDLDALVDNCRRHVAEGWKFLRWHLPQQPGRVLEPRPAIRSALQQLEAVRDAVGEDIELCLDVHTRLDLPDAVRLCRESEQFRPFFLEDPLRAENTHLYEVIEEDLIEVIEEDLIDYCRVDVCIAGDLTEARKIAGWCETHAIKLVTHNPLGPVSSAACPQLNLATSNMAVQEQPRRPGTTLTDVVPQQVE